MSPALEPIPTITVAQTITLFHFGAPLHAFRSFGHPACLKPFKTRSTFSSHRLTLLRVSDIITIHYYIPIMSHFATVTSSFQANTLPSVSELNTYFWNADTRATAHMTPHRHWLCSYRLCRVPVELVDSRDGGRVVYSEGIGSVVFTPVINGQPAR